MEPAVRVSLLWGVVGALSFLVLVQGYHLVASEFVGVGLVLGAATGVLAVSAAATHLLRATLLGRNERT